MTSFKKSFDEIAKIMLQKAQHPDASLTEVTDAFKAMTTYHALTLKHKIGEDIPGDDGFDFANGLGDEDGRVPGRRSS